MKTVSIPFSALPQRERTGKQPRGKKEKARSAFSPGFPRIRHTVVSKRSSAYGKGPRRYSSRPFDSPVEGMLEGCREGVAAGERSGDFEYASYSFALLTGCRLIYTMALGEAHRLNEEYIQRTLEMKQDRNVSALRAHKMFLENLLGRSASPLSMSTGELSEEDELKRARESHDLSYPGTVCVYRLMRDFIYGEFDAAAEEIERGKEFIAALTGQVSVSTYYLFAALTLLKSGKPLSRSEKRLIRKSFMNFRTWARTAPANHEHRLLWLRAQRDASEGKTERALKNYEAAARAALSRGFFGESGSCYECAGDYILERRGKTAAAGFYLTALESYEQWGAWGKLELFRKKLAEVLRSFAGYSGITKWADLTSEETPAPQPSFSSFFDRLSLLETSRIITAEKKPETLLLGLLEIFVKSSGATRGYLFLADGTEHFPASIVAAKNRGGTLRTERVSTEENGEPPLSLALKVYRTGETLGLKADSRKEFFNDPYLRRENPKAFYCSPLRHKSSIAGERYLEEENRTHLEKLMQAEKMATLGLLTSEIGHEINNMGHPLQLAAGQLEAVERDLTPLLREIAGEQLWEGASLGGLPINEAGRRLSEIITTIKESSGQIVRLATQLRGYYKEKEQGPAPVDLNEIVSSTLMLASHFINSSTDRFTFSSGDIPRINGNRRRLQQVFLNLIKNGCQSLESKNASLTVSTSPDETGRFVVAEVTDDGKGMDPETPAAAESPLCCK